MNYLVSVLYIVAFAMFIYGLMGLTGPKTAVRGNWIAAAGMAHRGRRHADRDPRHRAINWIADRRRVWLLGVVLGVPPARMTKMTAMPQLVALFNGVGGGTVALIAWAEFIETDGFSALQARRVTRPSHIVVASLFAAIIGSISFWGSLVAFGKLQEILPERRSALAGKAAAGRSTSCCCSARSPPRSCIGLNATRAGRPAVVDRRRAGRSPACSG